jgi:hypothetical protein
MSGFSRAGDLLSCSGILEFIADLSCHVTHKGVDGVTWFLHMSICKCTAYIATTLQHDS